MAYQQKSESYNIVEHMLKSSDKYTLEKVNEHLIIALLNTGAT